MEAFKELRASIVKACEASLDGAYHRLESELSDHEARLQEAQRHAFIADKARKEAECKVEELRREVSALKGELESNKVDDKSLELPEQYVRLEADFAPDRIWSGDLDDVDHLRDILETKYRSLYSGLYAFTQSWCSLKAKVLQHKKKLQHWDKQLHRDQFTLMVEGSSVTFRRVPKSDIVHSSSLSELPDSLKTRSSPADNYCLIKKEHEAAETISTVQHTLCDTLPRMQNNLNSDASLEVSEPLPTVRTRKRKRIVGPVQSKVAEDNPEKQVRVKDETLSSSPLNELTASSGPQIPSTQDLDEIGDTIQTPTKPHNPRNIDWDTVSLRTDSNGTVNKPRALKPIDGNARRTRLRDRLSDTAKQKHVDQSRYLSMTEDGDNGGSDHAHWQENPHSYGLAHAATKPRVAQGRLYSLLERPGPSISPLGHQLDKTPVANSHATPVDAESSEGSRTGNFTTKEAGSGTQEHVDVHPDDEPFRSRPLHRLTLDHFKLNPARNQGLDYAYDAVVRKKDDRKCLPGCTQPECCGDRFRAMARLGGLPARIPAEQHEEDQKVLQEYMGDEYPLLENMSAPDRERLLVEARARALANQYGRHRHNHQRARTPPGFWRTDMPSTQEIEADREAAQKMDRDRVEQRYREAMRPGGLWTWADE
ncbi:DNA repair protein Sae2/CtIP [Penicillium chermesinum]|nr:DNA repair protein Sae2/CtIP [Penicillium chermesinum]